MQNEQNARIVHSVLTQQESFLNVLLCANVIFQFTKGNLVTMDRWNEVPLDRQLFLVFLQR